MKKFTIIGLAICLAFALAAPVMAVDVDFSGSYYVRGSYVSHWNLRDTSASNAYMDMNFELQTVFKASDILSVTTRFNALEDHVWGTPTDEAGDPGNINFNRAYMTIKAPVGKFIIGRAGVGYWGTTFVDTVVEADCVKFIKKIDNLTLYAVYMKLNENDDNIATDVADKDQDRYDLRVKYKIENTTTGLLFAFFNDKRTDDRTTHKYAAIPFFVSKFGPLGIQGELKYVWGETDYDEAGKADLDIKKLAYNLEATYNVGPASIMAGYAFLSGDSDAAAGNPDNETSAYGGVGEDWAKLFILTTPDVAVLQDNLGGVGNLMDAGNFGAKIIYVGATFSPLENLELGVVVGKADADEIPATMTKDDYGVEYDLTLNWKIYDNLTYSAVAAFLSAGDIYWNAPAGVVTAAPATFDDTYALFHQLELTF